MDRRLGHLLRPANDMGANSDPNTHITPIFATTVTSTTSETPPNGNGVQDQMPQSADVDVFNSLSRLKADIQQPLVSKYMMVEMQY